MTNLTEHQLSLGGATWIDVNTNVTLNVLPDRLPDTQAIRLSSLINLFNCPIGGRSRLFEPTYGTVIYELLQEPIDEVTAQSIQIGILQAIQKWEPRIILDFRNTHVIPDYSLPGYRVRLSGVLTVTSEPIDASFALQQGA